SAVKNGFNLVPADGGYKLSFTDEDFANLFKGYLRPRTSQILFPN
ncbi:MAG: V-type ATP synthase subunit E, partial [Candidatus Cloacimonetes bacterium]|nr:V-type ATP synthase subunit E [Candidatus Cloacimonadota bacterium]